MSTRDLTEWIAAELTRLDHLHEVPWSDAGAESERTEPMTEQRIAITIESGGIPGHTLRFTRGGGPVATLQLTQGEMIDLWQKIGAYFNFQGMADLGERIHEHRYSGQTLRHSHDGGNEPHGYFQHAEDFPQEQPGPDETYNGQPFETVQS